MTDEAKRPRKRVRRQPVRQNVDTGEIDAEFEEREIIYGGSVEEKEQSDE